RATLGGSLGGRTVTVLGAAFKPDSDDVRDSPALDVAATLHNSGARVVVHDPKALENAARVYPNLIYQQDLIAALTDTELVLHLTEWREYRDLDPATIPGGGTRHCIDGRNTLDPQRWRAAGWTYRALGRPLA
ncbi:MAG: UDP binding domain-containing protein, partial [Actinomycetales bacterium]